MVGNVEAGEAGVAEGRVGEGEEKCYCPIYPRSAVSGTGMAYPAVLSIPVEYLEISLGFILAILSLSSITSCGRSNAAIKLCIAFSFPMLPLEDDESCAV